MLTYWCLFLPNLNKIETLKLVILWISIFAAFLKSASVLSISLWLVSSLSISVLRNLKLEANKLYDIVNKFYNAALLTKCYVQHFFSPYIDSEVNHKWYFIKIPFINKDMEFIHLHCILKDNLVIYLFQITLIIQKLQSVAINITNQLVLLYLTWINL